jgi:hypothetical protein
MGERKKDEHGEYNTDAGSTYPVEADKVGYEPCNAVLKYTWDRYGERRYCTGMASSNFQEDGSQFCKHHRSREELMKQHEKQLTTGAHASSHEHTFQYMPLHKQLIANDLFKSLLSESTYDFDTNNVSFEVAADDSDIVADEVDTVVIDHPVPQEYQQRGKALWFAALDFVTMESIREEQFRVAAEEDHEGRSLAIGETTQVVSVTDDGQEITDTAEHHLNLPLSRIQKDYKEHMKFGGVEYDADDDSGSMTSREWVAVVEPDETDPQPEAIEGDTTPMADIDMPDDA